jgi:hypothetical protein
MDARENRATNAGGSARYDHTGKTSEEIIDGIVL